MIKINWYKRIAIFGFTAILFLILDLTIMPDSLNITLLGAGGWQIIDQIVYTIRFKQF